VVVDIHATFALSAVPWVGYRLGRLGSDAVHTGIPFRLSGGLRLLLTLNKIRKYLVLTDLADTHNEGTLPANVLKDTQLAKGMLGSGHVGLTDVGCISVVLGWAPIMLGNAGHFEGSRHNERFVVLFLSDKTNFILIFVDGTSSIIHHPSSNIQHPTSNIHYP